MKLDPQITKDIQEWLNTPEKERDIKAGADLMLSLNRNRALYNSIIRRPDKFLPKLVYELRKYLRMRLDNMAVTDVIRMEAAVMPAAKQTLESPVVISSDDEIPEGAVARGRRADHDSLPAHIRDLWDSNADRYVRIRLFYNELKAMHDSQPCDRYEKLVMLDELDKKYRANLSEYDSYDVSNQARMSGQPSAAPASQAPVAEVSNDNEKTLNNARKTLSKYRKVLAGLPANDPRRQTALEKIQSAVSSIIACGAGVADDTRAELEALGISFG